MIPGETDVLMPLRMTARLISRRRRTNRSAVRNASAGSQRSNQSVDRLTPIHVWMPTSRMRTTHAEPGNILRQIPKTQSQHGNGFRSARRIDSTHRNQNDSISETPVPTACFSSFLLGSGLHATCKVKDIDDIDTHRARSVGPPVRRSFAGALGLGCIAAGFDPRNEETLGRGHWSPGRTVRRTTVNPRLRLSVCASAIVGWRGHGTRFIYFASTDAGS